MGLNNFRTEHLIWDRVNSHVTYSLETNSGDSNGRKLRVQVLDGGVVTALSGVTLSLAWKTVNQINSGLDAFKLVDVALGIFEIYYTTEMLSNVGKLKASLVLVDATGRMESDTFPITVNPTMVDDNAVQGENSFTALTEALVKVNEWNGRIDDVEQDYADRAENLEETYAPRLTEVTAQLAQIASYGNVKSYGAVGDGITDDTEAIQKCFDECSIVEFSDGRFLSKSIYVKRRRVVVKGQGDGSIVEAHKDAIGNLFSIAEGVGNLLFENIRMNGNIEKTPANTNPLNAIGEEKTDNIFVKERIILKNVIVMNFNGTGFYFPSRGLTYSFDTCATWNLKGYGVYLGNVSDSEFIGGHIAGADKAGISINGGSNHRFVGVKVCLNGKGNTPFAGIELNYANYCSFNGCEIQQNCYDGILLNHSNGNTIDGVVFDSNNKLGLIGLFGQLKLIESSFNRVSAVIVDGRFSDHVIPFNMHSLYGIIEDAKSSYNKFDYSYAPNMPIEKRKRITPFYSELNDISSVFKINNYDYFDFSRKVLNFNDNTSIASTFSGNIPNVITSNTTNILDFKTNQAISIATGQSYFRRLLLDINKLNLKNKSKLYVSYQSKVTDGITANVLISEKSDVNTEYDKTGMIEVTRLTRNTTYMPEAKYKTLKYSNEAGYVLTLEVSIYCENNVSLNESEFIASLKDIVISAT